MEERKNEIIAWKVRDLTFTFRFCMFILLDCFECLLCNVDVELVQLTAVFILYCSYFDLKGKVMCLRFLSFWRDLHFLTYLHHLWQTLPKRLPQKENLNFNDGAIQWNHSLRAHSQWAFALASRFLWIQWTSIGPFAVSVMLIALQLMWR